MSQYIAIYLKKYVGCNGSLAFLSPCIAKINEIRYKNTDGHIEYNDMKKEKLSAKGKLPLTKRIDEMYKLFDSKLNINDFTRKYSN